MADVTLDIESELPKAIRWTNEHTRQLPFSISQAINGTAQGDRMRARRERSVIAAAEVTTKRLLDRPKSTTIKSYRVAQRATKRNLQALIVAKDKPYKRNSYITGNIRGGERPQKNYERVFIGKASRAAFSSTTRLVPTHAIKPDRYGNVTKRRIEGLLSKFSTTYESGALFAGVPRGVVEGRRRPAGIYRRHNRNKRLTALFIDSSGTDYGTALYTLRPDMARQAQKTFGPLLRTYIERNVQREIANPKRNPDLRTGLFY